MSEDKDPAQAFSTRQFDYLVVGGGTAGLVVASRLSERGDVSIGVLEAGEAIPTDTPAVSVPGRFGDGIGTEYDWKFETTPQKGLGGRKVPWPRGKALGGTSALNFMTWNRPSREDLDAWEKLGCDGWGWDDMLPYYKKSENFIEPDEKSKAQHTLHCDLGTHGKTGPVTVSFTKEHSITHQYWHKTLENLGVATNKSHMSGSNVGAWTSMVAVHPETATREYSAPAYYGPAKERKNLFVLTGANVLNIELEESGGEWIAKGVKLNHAGSTYVACASKEVILSAGSVKSPQLLEQSGIGSPTILGNAGVETKVQNNAVGENLQDHLLTATIYEVDPSTFSPDDLKNDPSLAAEADKEYENHRTGPRTLLACAFAYIPLPILMTAPPIVALCERFASPSKSDSRASILASRLSPSANLGHVEYIFDVGNWSPFLQTTPGKKYATLLQILQYPFSRGSIHLNPAQPYGPPIIDPQYYENEGDLDFEIMSHAAVFGEKVLSTSPLKGFVGERVWPPANIDRAAWRDWIRANTATDWHPVGTCAMGNVVDSRLRVFGVKGLRVVDASIMPLQISAHLQATVYAIGEKGAAMILEDLDLETR